jgi:hypothetical protein
VREGKLLDKSSTLSSYGTDVNVIKFAKIFTDSRGVQVTSLLSCFGGPVFEYLLEGWPYYVLL